MIAVLQAVLVAAAAIEWLSLCAVTGLVAARMHQLEEYDTRRLFRWGATREWLLHRAVLLGALPALVVIVLGAASSAVRGAGALSAAAWAAGAALAIVAWAWVPPKKPLVFTARARRLLAAAVLLAAVVAAAVGVLVSLAPPLLSDVVIAVLLLATPLLAMTFLVLANGLMQPVEASVRRGFIRRARSRLEQVQPLVIAVAGSYGKTSTKHILAHLLAPYGEVLATPKSFNTLMGITRAVNENLEERHRTFIVEMDAYAPGEIAAMCALVRPRHSILTSVGPQHLERFGTIVRIADALYECVQTLPADGVAIVYAGDDETAALAQRARSDGHATVSDATHGSDVVVEDIHVTGRGSTFTWSWPAENLRHRVELPLLGRHQALNVSAALAMVHRLGHPLQPALHAIGTLQPVEHRLQPVPTGNAITVIDDSYNANVVGVHNGLEVLAEIEAGHRILVTPGIVELGAVEEEENRRYGEHAARVCDHVIVVEARTGPALRSGLQQGGLDAAHVHTVASLDEATAVIARIAVPGDAVLFANDLPDTYL